MKKHLPAILRASLVILALAASGFAQTMPLLVDTAWLSEHLRDRNLVLLQVSSKPEYDAEHIPGARHITDMDIVQNSSMNAYDLPDPGQLRMKFASLGISDDSRIVVYFGRNGGVPSATRVIFTLDYIGLGGSTSLLNGGLAAWKRAGREVTASIPRPVTGTLSPRPTKSIVADVDLVKSVPQRSGYKLVDARAPAYYNGIEATHGKSGHIPGAVNIPFSNITGTDLMISRDRIAELFQTAGVRQGDTIVAYCHIGQQATAVVFAARLLGHNVMLYDGSFHDWAMNNQGAVEPGKK